MMKVKYTIKNADLYSSVDALKLFSQCMEIQLTFSRKLYYITFISHFVTSTSHLHKAQMSEPVTNSHPLICKVPVRNLPFAIDLHILVLSLYNCYFRIEL